MLKIRPLGTTPEAALAAALANAPYLRRLSERTEARSFEAALADVTAAYTTAATEAGFLD